jgi:hypothetical protein
VSVGHCWTSSADRRNGVTSLPNPWGALGSLLARGALDTEPRLTPESAQFGRGTVWLEPAMTFTAASGLKRVTLPTSQSSDWRPRGEGVLRHQHVPGWVHNRRQRSPRGTARRRRPAAARVGVRQRRARPADPDRGRVGHWGRDLRPSSRSTSCPSSSARAPGCSTTSATTSTSSRSTQSRRTQPPTCASASWVRRATESEPRSDYA